MYLQEVSLVVEGDSTVGNPVVSYLFLCICSLIGSH